MTTVYSLLVELLGDATSLGKATQSADNTVSTFATSMGKQMTSIGQGMTSLGTKWTIGVSLPIVAGSLKAIDAASDLSETINKVDVVFGDSADAINNWGLTSAESIGMSRQQAEEAAGTYGNLFLTMGLGQKPAADMSMSLVNLAADLASFNNASPEEVLGAMQSGLVGQVEPMRKYGVNLSEAAVKAKAMEMGLAGANGELTEAAKLQARYALILEQTTTSQGDFERTSSGLANQQRILKAQLADTWGMLGTILLPYALQFVAALGRFLEWVRQLTPEQQKWAVGIALVIAVMGPLLVILGTFIGALGTVITIIGAITAPILIVVAVIALIIAALALLYFAWKNNWWGIRDIVDSVITYISGLIQRGLTFWTQFSTGQLGWMSMIFKNTFDTITTLITNALAIWDHIQQAWKNIQNGSWYMFGVELRKIWDILMRSLGTIISNGWENLKLLFDNAIKKLWEKFKNIDWAELGRNLIQGIINGLFSKIIQLDNALRKIGQGIKDTLAGFFSIHSPSAVMAAEIGEPLGEGVIQGFMTGVRGLQMPTIGGVTGNFAMPATAGASALASSAKPATTVVVDYHPLISTADADEAKFVLAPMIEDEIRRRERGG